MSVITVHRKGDTFTASATVLGKRIVGDLAPTEAWALRHLETALREVHQATVDARVSAEDKESK